MTTGAQTRGARPWLEQWSIQARVKAETIEQQRLLAMAVPVGDGIRDARRRAASEAVHSLVQAANQATESRRWRPLWPWRGPLDRWRGTSVEQAYQSLHAAEIFLIELLPDEQVRALVPKVTSKAGLILHPHDPRRAQIDALPARLTGSGGVSAEIRATVQRAMEAVYEATDQLHTRLRDFRNILLVSTAMIGVLMIALVFLVAYHPTAMPLCFNPSVTSAVPATGVPDATQPPAGTTMACPTGDRRTPSGGDIVIVAGLGLLGGALAAAFAIRNLRGTSTPYDIPIALAWLKVPCGALTAVAGILLLGGNFLPGLSQLDSQPQILAYALVLGFAQQVGTRLIDNQAQTILNRVPSSDPGANAPPPPTGPPASGGTSADERSRPSSPAGGRTGGPPPSTAPPDGTSNPPPRPSAADAAKQAARVLGRVWAAWRGRHR